METRTADQTATPALWRDSAWGDLRLDDKNAEAITARIFRNRNFFAEEFGLVRYLSAVRQYPRTRRGLDFDHPEAYRTESGGVVLFVSNYRGPPPPSLGLARIPPIYSTEAESYAGRFASIKEMRASLAACGG